MIEIDPRGDRAAYLQVADALRNLILDGTYRPGSTLPSEARLEQETGLGRNTVRAAVEVLVAEGRVTKQRGRGTVVRAPQPRETVQLASGDVITARVPDEPEARRRDLARGVPVLEVLRPGEDQPVVYAADETQLKVP